MRWAIAIVAVLSATAEAKPASSWAGEWEYRYDDAVIAKAEVERLLPLRDTRPIDGIILDARVADLWLHRSAKDFTRWADWGPGWTAKARESLRRRTEQLAALETMKVPAELDPVKHHLVELGRFYLALEALELELLVADKPAAPTAPVGGVDVAKACAPQLAKALAATDRKTRLEVVAYDVGNCVNQAHAGAYPAAAWKAFLAKNRIDEHQHTELNGP